MTKEQLIEEARKRGIVPGAVCKSPSSYDEYTVSDDKNWYLDSGGGLTNGDGRMIWSARSQAWAEVVTAAPAPATEGLVDGMACEPDEHMRAAIVSKARELGMAYDGSYDMKLLAWETTGGLPLRHANTPSARVTPVTAGEFYDRLCRTPKPEPPIKVGEHTVHFTSGSIKVGCTTIDNATVRAIAAKLKDL